MNHCPGCKCPITSKIEERLDTLERSLANKDSIIEDLRIERDGLIKELHYYKPKRKHDDNCTAKSDVIKWRVSDLNLAPRTITVLLHNKIETINQQIQCTELDLCKMKGLGLNSRNLIIKELLKHGLTLKGLLND